MSLSLSVSESSGGQDELGDVRRELQTLSQEVRALRADMTALQEELSAGSSRCGVQVPSLETRSVRTSASSSPVRSFSRFETQGPDTWIDTQMATLNTRSFLQSDCGSRITDASDHRWNDQRLRSVDPLVTDSTLTFIMRITGADHRVLEDSERCVAFFTCCVWVVAYSLCTTVWIASGISASQSLSDHCKTLADILTVSAGALHWFAAWFCRPWSSLQGVRVAPIVSIIGISMCLRGATTLESHLSTTQGGLSLLPVILMIVVLTSSAQSAAAVVFQGECLTLVATLRRHCTDSCGPADHEVLRSHVQSVKHRWGGILFLHLSLQCGAIAFYTFAGLVDSKFHNWQGLVEQGGRVLSILCFILVQVVPLVVYNESLKQAELCLEDFPSAQRLRRMPLEFSVVGVVIDSKTFRMFFLAGMASAVGGLVKRVIYWAVGI